MTPLSLILLFALSAGCVLAGRLLFHYFQLESYQHPGYFRTVRRNALKAFLPGLIETLVLVLSLFLFGILCPEDNDWLPTVLVSAAVILCGILLYIFCMNFLGLVAPRVELVSRVLSETPVER